MKIPQGEARGAIGGGVRCQGGRFSITAICSEQMYGGGSVASVLKVFCDCLQKKKVAGPTILGSKTKTPREAAFRFGCGQQPAVECRLGTTTAESQARDTEKEQQTRSRLRGRIRTRELREVGRITEFGL